MIMQRRQCATCLMLVVLAMTTMMCPTTIIANAQQFPVYDGFSAAEVAAVGSSDRWKQYYKDTYYTNTDHFSPVTLTGFIESGGSSDGTSSATTTPLMRLVGVADQLSISPLLTGSESLHDKAMSLGVQPGLSGNAASGERAKASNAFRTRGVLLTIGGEDIVSMTQECATILPYWNISSSTPTPPFSSIKLTSLYNTLTRLLTASGATSSSSPLSDILDRVKTFNNENTKGTAADNSASALEMPLSLVIEEASSTSSSSSEVISADTILGYLRTPANAATVGMSCLLAQIRFSDPPLYSYSPDGLVAQVISSIVIADGSFDVLLGLNTQNNTTSTTATGQMLGDLKYVMTQKVVQELNRIDALGFHSQVGSISYFKTRSTVVVDKSTQEMDHCTSGPSSASLYCRLFVQRSTIGDYFTGAAGNFGSLVNRGLANMREVFGIDGYGNPAYKKGSAAALRPAFVQESKANMYLSSNAPVQADASVGVTYSTSGNVPLTSILEDTPAAPLTNTQQQHHTSSSGTYSSSPNCLEQSSPTCSPQGGLNIWSTTYLPPPPTSNTSTTMDSMPNGSIAILVPISSGGMFHDNGIPGASSVAPDLAAVLAAIDAISSASGGGGIVASLLQNTSMIGHLYFFFLTGEEYGFMGSGRLVKEMESFKCSIGNGRAARQNNTNESSTTSATTPVDCEFPYYWFTNFTSINLDRFSHFISVEGVLDDLAVDDINAATVPFYAYTDSRLSSSTTTSGSSSSPNQVLVNNLLGQISTVGTQQQQTKFNISLVNFHDILSGGDGTAMNDSMMMNMSFQVLSVPDISVPTSNIIPTNGSCTDPSSMPSSLFNISIRTTIPPCSLWPLMASKTLTTASASELISAYQQQPVQDGNIDYLPKQWRSKSFTLITSRPPQIFIPTTTTDGTGGGGGLDASYPYLKGTLDTAANLIGGGDGNAAPSVSSSAHLRFDRVTSITHAASEILATLLTGLVNISSPDIPASTPPTINDTEKVNWTEVGRLWYCFGANINCEDDSTSDLLMSPNYYAGVFSYRWSITNVQAYITAYTALRLVPIMINTNVTTTSGDECLSDTECGSVYKSCQPTRMMNQNTTTIVMRCQYLRVQYTHSFSPAADYDANYPSLSRFVLDTPWIDAQPFTLSSSQNTCMWTNSLQLFDKSNAVVVAHGAGGEQRRHMIAVESYWGGDGIGIRTAAYLPPTSHYLTLMGGLIVLTISIVGGVIAMRFDTIITKLSKK